MSDETKPELMTPAEVARLFNVHPKTVKAWADAGQLSTRRTLGGHRRYIRAEIEARIDEAETGTEH